MTSIAFKNISRVMMIRATSGAAINIANTSRSMSSNVYSNNDKPVKERDKEDKERYQTECFTLGNGQVWCADDKGRVFPLTDTDKERYQTECFKLGNGQVWSVDGKGRIFPLTDTDIKKEDEAEEDKERYQTECFKLGNGQVWCVDGKGQVIVDKHFIKCIHKGLQQMREFSK